MKGCNKCGHAPKHHKQSGRCRGPIPTGDPVKILPQHLRGKSSCSCDAALVKAERKS